jgi:cell division protein ZapA
MATVMLKIAGRSFRLECGPGEEHRLVLLADDLQNRLDALVRDFGAVGIDRLLLMAALMISDELYEAREKLAELETLERPREVA